jgi:Ca2+-binding EF-hand superfamily protein
MTCDAEVATDSSEENTINFGEFVRLMTARKKRQQAVSDDDLLEAYVACGGDEDGGGCVNADILVRVIKEDFQLAIDIKELIMAVDEDGSGEIEFDEVSTSSCAVQNDGFRCINHVGFQHLSLQSLTHLTPPHPT